VLRRLIALAPEDAEAYHNLGCLLLEQDRAAEAIGCYEQVLRLGPEYPGARQALEQARRQAGGHDGLRATGPAREAAPPGDSTRPAGSGRGKP